MLRHIFIKISVRFIHYDLDNARIDRQMMNELIDDMQINTQIVNK